MMPMAKSLAEDMPPAIKATGITHDPTKVNNKNQIKHPENVAVFALLIESP
jgi:hypothetical protein